MTTVLMGEGTVLYALTGDKEGTSQTDRAGDDRFGGVDGAPTPFTVALHAGMAAERDQEDFSGEAAAEPAGESGGTREPPTPADRAWLGTVIGAVDHGA